MKRFFRPLVGLGLLALGALVGYYLYAWSRGDHFFRARPTRYWRSELREFAKNPDQWSQPWPDRLLDFIGATPRPGWPGVMGQDPAAVPVLIDLVTDDDEHVRHAALDSLMLLGPAATAAVPAVRQATATDGYACVTLVCISKEEAISCCIEGIWRQDPRRLRSFLSCFAASDPSEDEIREILRLLEVGKPITRWAIAVQLQDMGPAARVAIPALRKATQDNDRLVRGNAKLALERLIAISGPSVPPRPDGSDLSPSRRASPCGETGEKRGHSRFFFACRRPDRPR
jgi:hypothetical protein